jgi:hypothetical protein
MLMFMKKLRKKPTQINITCVFVKFIFLTLNYN